MRITNSTIDHEIIRFLKKYLGSELTLITDLGGTARKENIFTT